MTEYDNTNSGALFKNKEKDEAHPNWPDYQGSINVDGVDYWLSSWLKTSKDGKKYMSLSVRPKESKRQASEPASYPDDPNDKIPF